MSGAPVWAIVPVKGLTDPKARLASVLPPAARRQLATVMLEDVLATLGAVEALRPVLVVTPDAAIAALAEGRGAMVLREDEAEGHSAAVMRGMAYARQSGAEQALTIPGDVPLVTASELRGLARNFQAGAFNGAKVVLVPSHDGDGTNAILSEPPGLLEPSFGPGSFARHVAQAKGRGLRHEIVRLPGLGADVDEPADLERLMKAKRGSQRYAFLEEECGRGLGKAR